LKNKKQAVPSDFFEILSGVPQGSILGPILVNIFINDLIYHMECRNVYILNYADDNSLSAHADSIIKLKEILDEAAHEALLWLENNDMIANPDKFKFVVPK
jgi:ribonuclease P/MRP protein subunit RPP40